MKTKRKEKKLKKVSLWKEEDRGVGGGKNRSVTNKWWRWCQHLHLLRKSRLWWWSGGQNANSRGRSSLRLPSSGIGVIIIIRRRRRRRWGQGSGTGRQQRGYEIMKQNRLHDNDYPANNWNRNEKRSALAQRECEWEWNWNCLLPLPRFVPLIPPFLHLSFTLSPCVCVCVLVPVSFQEFGPKQRT